MSRHLPALLVLGLLVPMARAEEKPRTLEAFYALRAYAGAPPVYRHTVEGDVESVGDACLSCHKRGSGGAPITPHPNHGECRQCHVRQTVTTLFKPTEWTAAAAPKRGQRALPGSPVIAAHEPGKFRQACATCHSSKTAMKEIRSPHPERTACVQCHVPQTTQEEWTRPVVANEP